MLRVGIALSGALAICFDVGKVYQGVIAVFGRALVLYIVHTGAF